MIRIALATLLLAAPAAARDVPLAAGGLPFTPEAPRALPADHPLFGNVALDPLAGVPGKVGGLFGSRATAVDAGLRETLQQLGMLAPDGGRARFRLQARWIGLDSPFRISFSSRATARLAYVLQRTDDGRTIFTREIATSAQSSGGDATARKRGVERVAIMTNFASAARCLDKAAYGQAPQDCALAPAFTYNAPRPTMVVVAPR